MTTWEYAHQRGRSVAQSLSRTLLPRARALTKGVAATVRKTALPVVGVGCFVAAAFTASLLAGLIAAGLACFFVEWRFSK